MSIFWIQQRPPKRGARWLKASTGRAQVLPWGILGLEIGTCPQGLAYALGAPFACPSLLHVSSGSFPRKPGHVASPAGVRGGGVKTRKQALHSGHPEQLALEDSRGSVLCQTLVPSREVLGQMEIDHWVEGLG